MRSSSERAARRAQALDRDREGPAHMDEEGIKKETAARSLSLLHLLLTSSLTKETFCIKPTYFRARYFEY